MLRRSGKLFGGESSKLRPPIPFSVVVRTVSNGLHAGQKLLLAKASPLWPASPPRYPGLHKARAALISVSFPSSGCSWIFRVRHRSDEKIGMHKNSDMWLVAAFIEPLYICRAAHTRLRDVTEQYSRTTC